MDGAKRIASHYKFALGHIFSARPEAPAAIIVEDDFLFSPDFLDYFMAVAPILEHDPTTYVLSAWNDNGLKGPNCPPPTPLPRRCHRPRKPFAAKSF